MGTVGVVDELIVLDDRSTDDTARVAAHAGARVVSIDDVHAVHGTGHGKGNALWATLLVSQGDFIVWCDGDVTSFEPELGAASWSPHCSTTTRSAWSRRSTTVRRGTEEAAERPNWSLDP